tara:strand:+ start:398 stop:1420 length:1023 start_codon:yes stop_codon:yes gene_type:complete
LFTYQSNINLGDAAEIIRRSEHVTVVTHAKPDGDAFGAVVALSAALRQMDKQVHAWFVPPVPQSFCQLRGGESVGLFKKETVLDESDLVVVLDTGAESQLAPMGEQLKAMLPQTMIIDHHLSGGLKARWRYVDQQAAACCEIVTELLDHLTVDFGPVISNALYVGIAADTGWFRFSNTRPQTFELAARLLRCGVDHADLFTKVEQYERPQKLALMVRALDSVKLMDQNRVAVMQLCAKDFHETHCDVSDTERFIDIPQVVASVNTVVLITEPPANKNEPQPAIRVSFRSKPGQSAVNVAELAGLFGGGGHARAAGAKIDLPLERVVDQVTAAVVRSSISP